MRHGRFDRSCPVPAGEPGLDDETAFAYWWEARMRATPDLRVVDLEAVVAGFQAQEGWGRRLTDAAVERVTGWRVLSRVRRVGLMNHAYKVLASPSAQPREAVTGGDWTTALE